MLEVYLLNNRVPLKADEKALFMKQVSEEKQKKVARYRREIDGQRTLLGEVLMRVVLAKHMNTQPSHMLFKKNEYGKPYLEDNPLYFNISHSGEWIVGVVSDQLVGVDVEEIKQADLDIAQRFFTKAEYQSLAQIADNEEKNKTFYTFWSGKESYIKMIGKGLTIPLDAFSLGYQEGQLQLGNLYQEEQAYFTVHVPFQKEGYSLVICHKAYAPQIVYHNINIQMLYNMLEGACFDNPLKSD